MRRRPIDVRNDATRAALIEPGYRRLAAGVLVRAFDDALERHNDGARQFLTSSTGSLLQFWCALAGCSAEALASETVAALAAAERRQRSSAA